VFACYSLAVNSCVFLISLSTTVYRQATKSNASPPRHGEKRNRYVVVHLVVNAFVCVVNETIFGKIHFDIGTSCSHVGRGATGAVVGLSTQTEL